MILFLLCLIPFISYIDMRSFFSLPAFFFIPSSISPSCTSTFISHSLSARDIHFSCETSASALWSFPLPFNFIYGLFYTRHLRRRLLLLLFFFIHPSLSNKMLYSLSYSLTHLLAFKRRFIKKRASRHFVTNCKYSSSLWKPFRDGRHKNRLKNIKFFFLLSFYWILHEKFNFFKMWIKSRINLKFIEAIILQKSHSSINRRAIANFVCIFNK